MDEDVGSRGWPWRAGCRWAAYAGLWLVTVAVCLLASFHAVLAVAGALLGCLLATALPLLFATLFEAAYTRRARVDFPLLCCPWLGAVLVLAGSFVLLQASVFVVSRLSSVEVDSASELNARYATKPHGELPRTVCMRRAFIKTGWEAGVLRCHAQYGHEECVVAFAAAPMFNDRDHAEQASADQIWAWAVAHGRHIDANYRPDGTLCGYLMGIDELDLFLGEYHLAVLRVIKKKRLHLTEVPAEAQQPTPLENRPILMSADPGEATYREQAWLLAALLLLCCCPCVGPVPLGSIFLYFCWSRSDRYAGRHVVPSAGDDYMNRAMSY